MNMQNTRRSTVDEATKTRMEQLYTKNAGKQNRKKTQYNKSNTRRLPGRSPQKICR